VPWPTALIIKITNAYQAANGSESALPLKYRAVCDYDGRYFICSDKKAISTWTGAAIDIDMAGI